MSATSPKSAKARRLRQHAGRVRYPGLRQRSHSAGGNVFTAKKTWTSRLDCALFSAPKRENKNAPLVLGRAIPVAAARVKGNPAKKKGGLLEERRIGVMEPATAHLLHLSKT